MTFSHPQTSALPIYSRLNLLRFSDLIALQNVLFIKNIRCNSGNIPSSLVETFDIDFTHARLTRGFSAGSVNITRTNTRKFGTFSIRSRSISSWNSLLALTDFSFLQSSPATLKHKLTSFLISSYQ